MWTPIVSERHIFCDELPTSRKENLADHSDNDSLVSHFEGFVKLLSVKF